MKKEQWGQVIGLVVFLILVTVGAIRYLPALVMSGESQTEETYTEAVNTGTETAEEEVLSENAVSDKEVMTVSEDAAESASENAGKDPVSEKEDPEEIAAVSENTTAETETVSDNTISDLSASENRADETVRNDQMAPLILDVNSSPQVKTGDAFDIHKYIGYADDVDRSVDMEVDGEVDTMTEGEYPLTITLRDDAGHTTTQKMNVQVVAEVSSSGNTGRAEAFSDFIERYKTEDTAVGIDISRWQEDVDFERVKAAGCEFVYMRIGGYDDGELYTDRYYRNNIAGARAAGLKIGIYWHAEECNAQEVKNSVAYLLEVLDGEQLDFPIAYDWEDFRHFENYGMNFYDLSDNLDVFAEEIEKGGYEACLYNSKYYLETIWPGAEKHPIWLANYTSATTYRGEYFMWQHSCTGRIDGIEGAVDLDVLYIR